MTGKFYLYQSSRIWLHNSASHFLISGVDSTKSHLPLPHQLVYICRLVNYWICLLHLTTSTDKKNLGFNLIIQTIKIDISSHFHIDLLWKGGQFLLPILCSYEDNTKHNDEPKSVPITKYIQRAWMYTSYQHYPKKPYNLFYFGHTKT